MHLSLYDYQSKANRYRNGLAYLKNRVIPNEKNTIDSHTKKERKELRHNTKESHQTTEEKEGNKKEM